MSMSTQVAAVAVLLMVSAAVAGAEEAAFSVPLTLGERARVAGCGRSKGDVAVRLHVPLDGSWAVDGLGAQGVQGAYETRGRRGTKLLLSLDAAALAVLGARIDEAAAAVCGVPRTLGAVTLRKFIVKLNRRRTKARLKLKAQATLEDGKLAVLSWRGVGLTEPLDPSPTTTTVSSGTTSTSTTLPCTTTVLPSMSPLTIASTTSGAGNDAAPADTCFDFGVPPSNGEDVLYSWTAPSAGTFVFDTLTPGIDTVLYAYDGCSGPARVCNDDFVDPPDGNHGSFIGVEMTAGQSIVVVVDSYDTSGDFTLEIAGPVAGGDCCAQRKTGGCELPGIETCLCEVDGPCCTSAWDRLCVAEAMSFCGLQCG